MSKTRQHVGFYDRHMWQSIERRAMELQTCAACGTVRYPPGPACPHCLSLEWDWRPVSGRGTIMSWVTFHRQYFDDFPPPYNAVAVRLVEGPIVVTNLIGTAPSESWIGKEVVLDYVDHDGRIQHAVRVAG